MSNSTSRDLDHRDTWDVLPWYVNGRLSEHERQQVDAHLRTCAACRNELAEQRQLHAILAADSSVEQLPTAGLKRLRQRLAAQNTAVAAPSVAQTENRIPARRLPWQMMMAASFAVMAVALSVVAGVLWSESRRSTAAGEYFTVTTATPRAAGEVIRAVFASTITLAELQAVLDDARLKIVAGPTEAGVYSLSPVSSETTDWSLLRLRRQPAVRFAETIVAEADAAHAR